MIFQYTIGPRNKYVPLDILLIYTFNLDAQDTSVNKQKKNELTAEAGQVCTEITVFKEKHVFDIPIILCLGTSLSLVWCFRHGMQTEIADELLQDVGSGDHEGAIEENRYIYTWIVIDINESYPFATQLSPSQAVAD